MTVPEVVIGAGSSVTPFTTACLKVANWCGWKAVLHDLTTARHPRFCSASERSNLYGFDKRFVSGGELFFEWREGGLRRQQGGSLSLHPYCIRCWTN